MTLTLKPAGHFIIAIVLVAISFFTGSSAGAASEENLLQDLPPGSHALEEGPDKAPQFTVSEDPLRDFLEAYEAGRPIVLEFYGRL